MTERNKALRDRLKFQQEIQSNLEDLFRLYEVTGEFPYIHCPQCGTILLTVDEYWEQMGEPGARWNCPVCFTTSRWLGGDL